MTPEFAAKVKQLGFSTVDADELIRLRIHGVSPEYIAQAKSYDKDITLDEVIQHKIRGQRVTSM